MEQSYLPLVGLSIVPRSPEAEVLRESVDFENTVKEFGPLVSASTSAKAVGLTPSRVRQLVNDGKVRPFAFFGKEFVAVLEVQRHVMTRTNGRPVGWRKVVLAAARGYVDTCDGLVKVAKKAELY